MEGFAALIRHLQAGGQLLPPATGGAPPYNIPKEILVAALQRTMGNITLAAQHLKCSRETFYKYLRLYPEIDPRAIRADCIEEVKDWSEGHLFKAIRTGDLRQVQFFLKHQAKDRGYATRREHTGKDGEDIRLDHNHFFTKSYGFDPDNPDSPEPPDAPAGKSGGASGS